MALTVGLRRPYDELQLPQFRGMCPSVGMRLFRVDAPSGCRSASTPSKNRPRPAFCRRRSVSYHLGVEAGVRTGGCLCGAVRYSVRGDPVHVGRCHCADCRKESGSAFIVYGHWPVEAFEVSGEISSYGGRGFCPLCGSRLLDPVGPGDTLIEIRLGSLDEAPFELKPEAEVWVKRRESWLLPVEGAAQHDENRP